MSFSIIGNIKNIPKPNKSEFSYLKELKKTGINSWEDFYKQGMEIINNGNPNDVRIPEKAPILYRKADDLLCSKLESVLKITEVYGKYQILEPEKIVMVHSDIFRYNNGDYITCSLTKGEIVREQKELDKKVARLMIMLDDHVFGQGIIYEDKPLINWRAGDVILVNNNSALHYTLNASYWDRYMLRIVGNRTEEFNILSKNTFYLSI